MQHAIHKAEVVAIEQDGDVFVHPLVAIIYDCFVSGGHTEEGLVFAWRASDLAEVGTH